MHPHDYVQNPKVDMCMPLQYRKSKSEIEKNYSSIKNISWSHLVKCYIDTHFQLDQVSMQWWLWVTKLGVKTTVVSQKYAHGQWMAPQREKWAYIWKLWYFTWKYAYLTQNYSSLIDVYACGDSAMPLLSWACLSRKRCLSLFISPTSSQYCFLFILTACTTA